MANMNEERAKKFQWISLIYLVLFMMAVFAPSLINRDYLGIPETHVEELLIFLFGFTGIVIFMLYERLMESKEKENREMADAYEHAKTELVSSYQYIGSVNRQLDVLKKLINDTSVSMYEQAKLGKELLHSLVSAASVSYGGKPALLRFVHLDKLRTEREFAHVGGNGNGSGHGFPYNVSNRDLKSAHDQGNMVRLTQEKGALILVPSDRRQGNVKAFLIVHDASEGQTDYDASILKVFVNQAEVVFRSLQQKDEALNGGQALDLVDAATQNVQGTIE
jgi:hypothetical protein